MTEPPGNDRPTLDRSASSTGSGLAKNLRGARLVQRMGLPSIAQVPQPPRPFRGTSIGRPDASSRSIFKAEAHYSIANCRHFGYVYPS
jgi:hypothetical protein